MTNRARTASVAAASTALWICLAAASAGGQQRDPADAPRVTFRAGVETIVVGVTARDARGRLVTTLGRDDFQLLIDGRSVPIEVFSKERHELRLGILLHRGSAASMARARDIGLALVDSLEPRDQAFIGTFGLEIALSPLVTSKHDILQRVLREEVWPGHGANLVGNAVEAALAALPRDKGQRALVIVGNDSAQSCGVMPCLDDGASRRHAAEQGVVVYGIVVRETQLPLQIPGYPVERMANATGGGYFRIDSADHVASEMSRVTEELRHEYLLGFTPAIADHRSHAVTVRVAERGVRTVARLKHSAGPR